MVLETIITKIEERAVAKEALMKIANKHRLRLLREGMAKWRLDLELTQKLTMRQSKRLLSAMSPLYVTLIWLQDPTYFHWLKSFSEELESLPLVYILL